MDKTFLTMSHKELNRYDIVKRLTEGEIKGPEAARLMNLSPRQTRRLKSAVIKGGAKALSHGNRGKKGNRSIPDEEKEKIIKLLKDKYCDFWPAHARPIN